MSTPAPPTYKTRNWPTYNTALNCRGSLSIWFDPAITWEAAPTVKSGRQRDCRGGAVQTCLTMKALFGMALRQPPGLVESLPRLVGLDWALGSARFQHPVGAAEDPKGEPRPRLPPTPADRQHRDKVLGRRGVEGPQTRRHETTRLAQDPHRERREVV